MGRTILISGALGGIGRACAAWFEEKGDTVLPLDRAGGQDACDPSQVELALSGHDTIDVVVHAAGATGVGGIEAATVASWRHVLDDNLTSAFVVCQAAIPRMGRGGSIILFSSVNGRHGGNRLSGPAYAAAKAAIIGLTRHLAKDCASAGIRVNALAPGPVATPMLARLSSGELEKLRQTMPLGAITEPEEIAGTVGWLCSPDARSITGVILDIGGIWMG
jgi:3-oxoacyl-[acyl-carrier protein] reductase